VVPMSLVKCEGCGKQFQDSEMLFVQAGAEGKWFCKNCDEEIEDMYEDYTTRFNVD